MTHAPYLVHFSTKDPILHTTILEKKLPLRVLEPITDSTTYFVLLCENIISQQLAGKAADAICARFRARLPGQKLTPQNILQTPQDDLRAQGLSWAKVRAIVDLAHHTDAGHIHYDNFLQMTDDEIIAELVQVKGIGRWTAEMFLMFTLGREDVFSFGDYGLKKGFQKMYAHQDEKTLKKRMEEVTAQWAPYKSYGSLALWACLDVK